MSFDAFKRGHHVWCVISVPLLKYQMPGDWNKGADKSLAIIKEEALKSGPEERKETTRR